jgi:hypothetical protein
MKASVHFATQDSDAQFQVQAPPLLPVEQDISASLAPQQRHRKKI